MIFSNTGSEHILFSLGPVSPQLTHKSSPWKIRHNSYQALQNTKAEKSTKKGDFKNQMTAKDETSTTYNNQGNTVD